jgi:hypothetical protein
VRALTADLQQTPSNQKNYRAEELPGFNGFDRVTFLDSWQCLKNRSLISTATSSRIPFFQQMNQIAPRLGNNGHTPAWRQKAVRSRGALSRDGLLRRLAGNHIATEPSD